MRGMILNHAIQLADLIRNHGQLIRLKTARMNDLSLPIQARAQAGKDFMHLCTERMEFREELEEILDAYFTDSLLSELYEIQGL